METAFKDEKERLNRAKDPAHLLYHFGKGIDSALKEILDESSWFLNTLKILGEKINADFEEIHRAIELAEKEVKDLENIEEALEKIKGEIERENKSIKNIQRKIRRLKSKVMGEEKKVVSKVKKETNTNEDESLQKPILLEEETLKRAYNYLTELERALKGVQNAIQKVESSTLKITEILNSLKGKSFKEISGKVENTKKNINSIIGELREIVEKYYGLFYNLRRDISIKVRNLCQELLQIEKQVKIAEKTTATARAS